MDAIRMRKRSFGDSPLDYCSCYCEENIYKFCQRIEDLSDYFVLFISSLEKTTPIWCQKACSQPGKPVVWDYHVILLYRPSNVDKHEIDKISPEFSSEALCTKEECLIYDLDTLLDFPVSLNKYVQKSFSYQEISLPFGMQQ